MDNDPLVQTCECCERSYVVSPAEEIGLHCTKCRLDIEVLGSADACRRLHRVEKNADEINAHLTELSVTLSRMMRRPRGSR